MKRANPKFLLVAFALPLIATATDLYVSKNLDYGSGPNGTVVEGDAVYSDLQTAINAAQVDSKTKVGDTVWVKDGFVCDSGFGGVLCYLSSTTNRIYINKAITVRSQSGYVDEKAGRGATIRGAFAAGDQTSSTYMHCSTSSVCCVYITAAATLQGFIMEGGSSRCLSSAAGCGGLDVRSAALITNCVVRNCYGFKGGGVYVDGAATLEDCVISNNVAKGKWKDEAKKGFEGEAGGMKAAGNCIIRKCRIEHNRSHSNAGGLMFSGKELRDCKVVNNVAGGNHGGGMDVSGGTPLIVDCLIATNTATKCPGGGASVGYMNGGIPTFRHCRFEKNTGSNGGAIWSQDNIWSQGNPKGYKGRAVVVDCEICENTASSGGGIYGAIFSMTNCIVRGNSCTSDGGGLVTLDRTGSDIRVCNTLITENTSTTYSAGIACGAFSMGSACFVNCTVAGNVLNPGHPYGCAGIGGTGATLINTICWGNVKGSGLSYDTIRAATNSCIHLKSGVETGPGCIDTDPKFVGTGDWPYVVRMSSPCRGKGLYDAADPAWAWATEAGGVGATALNGVPRIQHDKIDMGAFERKGYGLNLIVR